MFCGLEPSLDFPLARGWVETDRIFVFWVNLKAEPAADNKHTPAVAFHLPEDDPAPSVSVLQIELPRHRHIFSPAPYCCHEDYFITGLRGLHESNYSRFIGLLCVFSCTNSLSVSVRSLSRLCQVDLWWQILSKVFSGVHACIQVVVSLWLRPVSTLCEPPLASFHWLCWSLPPPGG